MQIQIAFIKKDRFDLAQNYFQGHACTLFSFRLLITFAANAHVFNSFYSQQLNK